MTVPDLSEYEDPLIGMVRRKLGGRKFRVETLADELEVPPKQIRWAIDVLREQGFRIPEESSGAVELVKVAPSKAATAHKALLDGDDVEIAFVSDTHLSSRECALEHLHLAYQDIADRGFKEVYHAGDLVAGRGIYATQDQDIINHTFETQVGYAVANYPRHPGLQTILIGGNHDLEGAFGRMGADPVAGVASRRDDFTYLGPYSADVELPNGAHFKMVHGRGGGAYAISYKCQKWVEGLPPGRKPAFVMFGHWHVTGWFIHRNIHLLLAGCFEWQTNLLVRLGLQPVVGYWILKLRLAEDGTVVRFVPEFTQFQEGRRVAA